MTPHIEQKAGKLSSNPCAFTGMQVPGTICRDYAKLIWECSSRPLSSLMVEDPRLKLRYVNRINGQLVRLTCGRWSCLQCFYLSPFINFGNNAMGTNTSSCTSSSWSNTTMTELDGQPMKSTC